MKPPSMTYQKALEILIAGNERYQKNEMTHITKINEEKRKELISDQNPFATILSCSDSRVSPEHIFDAAPGDLFVCRNAGNLLEPGIIGSMEYAVAHTGCPLIMVMGHSNCGAVNAAVNAFLNPDISESPNIDAIIRRMLPSVISIKNEKTDKKTWIYDAAKKNTENTCLNILKQSTIILNKVKEDSAALVGAMYDLETGKVEIILTKDKVLSNMQ